MVQVVSLVVSIFRLGMLRSQDSQPAEVAESEIEMVPHHVSTIRVFRSLTMDSMVSMESISLFRLILVMPLQKPLN